MKHPYLVLLCVAALAITALANDPPMPVPSDMGIRIKNLIEDQLRTSLEMQGLQSRYTTDQATLQHDAAELDSLNKEALETAKLDPTKYVVDDEKLEFTPKPPDQPKK